MQDDDSHPDTQAARRLLSAAAVRERAETLFRAGLEGRLTHFTLDLDCLDHAADEVVATIRAQYPTLEIPYHSRWRHFEAGGFDRWASLDLAMPWPDAATRARAAFDLAIVSVLLDAGAGAGWSYTEGRTGETFSRSEGLAVASFDLFIGGAFSGRPEDPFRADGATLEALDVLELARGLQVSPGNPIVGLEGRLSLLRRLGAAVETAPEIFGREDSPRPGGLFDHLVAGAPSGTVTAGAILDAILLHLGAVWPGRIELGDHELGDTWRHPLLASDDATSELVPFHKLSQWLAYSLIEPLEAAGIQVVDLDGLTGLPEYRNGGLFIDTGVVRLRDDADLARDHAVDSRLVVEWRALTVALLDRIAVEIRRKLDLAPAALSLAKVLEGGTWATGRRLARARRPGGEPPLHIVSDGTVF